MRTRYFLLIFWALAGCSRETKQVQLSDLLAKAQIIPAVEYETVLPASASSVTKVWQKGAYRKIQYSISEGTINGTLIEHADAAYRYDAANDRYIKTSRTPGFGNIAELAEHFKNAKMVIRGDDVVDGKQCVIINTVLEGPRDSFDYKHWVWKENGLTVRIKGIMRSGTTSMNIESENRNFIFKDIPDSFFAVPEDKIYSTVN